MKSEECPLCDKDKSICIDCIDKLAGKVIKQDIIEIIVVMVLFGFLCASIIAGMSFLLIGLV